MLKKRISALLLGAMVSISLTSCVLPDTRPAPAAVRVFDGVVEVLFCAGLETSYLSVETRSTDTDWVTNVELNGRREVLPGETFVTGDPLPGLEGNNELVPGRVGTQVAVHARGTFEGRSNRIGVAFTALTKSDIESGEWVFSDWGRSSEGCTYYEHAWGRE